MCILEEFFNKSHRLWKLSFKSTKKYESLVEYNIDFKGPTQENQSLNNFSVTEDVRDNFYYKTDSDSTI